jgi:peptidoglycan hydrolase-like protein with peptidoglycan-binding domain
LRIAALTSPAERTDDSIAISDATLLSEVRERLHELNFDPGPLNGPSPEVTRQAIQEFEQQNHLPPTRIATTVLIRRLQAIGGLKPWGAIVWW